MASGQLPRLVPLIFMASGFEGGVGHSRLERSLTSFTAITHRDDTEGQARRPPPQRNRSEPLSHPDNGPSAMVVRAFRPQDVVEDRSVEEAQPRPRNSRIPSSMSLTSSSETTPKTFVTRRLSTARS